jgi:hypothetical protein
LQAVASVDAVMELSPSAKRLKLWGKEPGYTIERFFVVAGGFDFD